MNKFKHNFIIIDSQGLTKRNWLAHFPTREVIAFAQVNPKALKQLMAVVEEKDV